MANRHNPALVKGFCYEKIGAGGYAADAATAVDVVKGFLY